MISGTCNKPVNKFIHVVLTNGNDVKATSFELLVTAIGDDAETEEYKDKGCGGVIETSLIGMAFISVLAGALLITRKRKVSE